MRLRERIHENLISIVVSPSAKTKVLPPPSSEGGKLVAMFLDFNITFCNAIFNLFMVR